MSGPSASSPSSRSSTLSSATHLPATREQQQQCPSVVDGRTSGALRVRELKPKPQEGSFVPPPPSYFPQQRVPMPPVPSALCWSSTSSSPNSLPGLDKRRSSWSNLVHQQAAESHLLHRPHPSDHSCPPPSSRPPSYGDFFTVAVPHLPTVASRQNSNASGGGDSSKSGVTYVGSKGSSSSSAYFRFAGLPAPLPASAARAESALTSSGGRMSSQCSNPSRPLQQQRGTVAGGGGGESGREQHEEGKRTRKKRDRMQELRDLWASPRCKLCCLALLITLIGALVAAAILTESFTPPKSLDFAWFPPDQFRAGGQTNRVSMKVGELGEQVRFELVGAAPFKSNFVSVFDFKTNRVAHLDRSLRSAQQNRQSVCFVVDLDRQNVPNMEALQRAAKAGAGKVGQLHGWQEDWHFTPNPVAPAKLFQPEIADCQGARWIELSRTQTDQKDQRCSECFDFCLPDWGIERDVIRDEQSLNLLRRICFHLFVPEWRPFAQQFSNQQNQQDFEEFYRRQQQQMVQGMGTTGQGQPQQSAQFGQGPLETRWVSLQTPAQQPQQPQSPNASVPFSSMAQGALLQLGHHLFAPSPNFPNGIVPNGQAPAPQPNVAMVHSQFSPPELNGPKGAAQQQQQQPQQFQQPPQPQPWSGWNGAAPPVGTEMGGGNGGGGAVPAAQPPQQQQQPSAAADHRQTHQSQQAQQNWVGKR